MIRHPRFIRLAAAMAAFLVPIQVSASGRGVARVTGTALRPCPTERQQPAGSMCGEVSVPEDRGIKGGRQIALSVVVLPGRSAAGRADPIFGIAGGPGIGSTRLAVSYPRLYDALQADHDIVLVDQRGTGDSHPLKCTAVAAPAESLRRDARHKSARPVPRSAREGRRPDAIHDAQPRSRTSKPCGRRSATGRSTCSASPMARASRSNTCGATSRTCARSWSAACCRPTSRQV